MNPVYWIASYPKSGNTWVRLFLAAYRMRGADAVSINKLGGHIAASREMFEEFAGIDASELTDEEILFYRPRVYLALARQQTHSVFLKAHDAFIRNSHGEPLFPEAATAGVVYLVRNPLDVAVSYAHHCGKDFDQIVEKMRTGNEPTPTKRERLEDQLPQQLLSWSGHLASWEASGLPFRIFRYEDLLENPLDTFLDLIQFVRLPVDMEQLEKAIHNTSFNVLRAQEEVEGFKERPPKSTRPFFREGKAGSWRNELPRELVRRVIDDHRPMMERFRYLPAEDDLVQPGEPK